MLGRAPQVCLHVLPDQEVDILFDQLTRSLTLEDGPRFS